MYIATNVPGQNDLPDFVEQTVSKLAGSGSDLRALRLLADSLREWISVAPIEVQTEVDCILLAEVGYGLFDAKKHAGKAAKALLKRGRIVSDDEFRFVAGLLDDSDQGAYATNDIERLFKLKDKRV